MCTLTKLPNIGEVLSEKLIEVGIDTPEELKKVGSREAFVRLKLADSTSCLNKLYALEGAIEGVRWHYLSDDTKKELKEFFKKF